MNAKQLIDKAVKEEIDYDAYGEDTLFRAIENLQDKLKLMSEEEIQQTTLWLKENQKELYSVADNALRQLEMFFN